MAARSRKTKKKSKPHPQRSERQRSERRERSSARLDAASDAATKSGAPIHIRSEAQLLALLKGPEPVLIDFWATWCGPCRTMAPIFERVAREFDGAVRFAKINTEEVPEVSKALGIRSIPTLVGMQGSDVIDSHVGLLPAGALTKMARRLDDHANGVTVGDRVKRWLGIGASAP